MEQAKRTHYTLHNMVHTILLMLALTGMIALTGWLFAGTDGLVVVCAAMIFMFAAGPRLSASTILKSVRARPLPGNHFWQLQRLSAQIAKRAGLSSVPKLYVMHSEGMNAFALGDRDNSGIVLSDSLVANLTLRELAGILGHEIAHIRNNDIAVMAVANMACRITAMLSMAGQIFILMSLPLILTHKLSISPLPLMLLILAPTVTLLLQLALSRTREYQADLVGVQLSGDINGLASALKKIERQQQGLWRKVLLAPWQNPSSLFLTHPPTRERINRLLAVHRAPLQGNGQTLPHGLT